jgi:hypothetical protein
MKTLVQNWRRAYTLPLLVVGLALTTWGFSSIDNGSASVAESIFNGRDLSGWVGDPRFWSVQDGAIVAQTTEANPTQGNTFLYWDGIVKDFTLTLEVKLTNHNSGIQYRSKLVDQYVVAGYQADLDGANRHTGGLYEEKGRGIVARRGQKVILETDSTRQPVVTQDGAVGDYDQLGTLVRVGDWNTVEISAHGNHIVHKVNGTVTADITDNNVNARAFSGVLALQLHAGPPMKVEFRNIQLTRHN